LFIGISIIAFHLKVVGGFNFIFIGVS